MDHLKTWTIYVLVRIGHVSFGEALKKIISQNLVAAIVTKVDTKVDINRSRYKLKLKT